MASSFQPFWIWSQTGRPSGKEVCLFRKEFKLEEKPNICEIKVSADSKYRLYVNGISVSRGPRKGDRYRRYYDTIDIAPYLQKGKNTIAALAVYFPDDEADSRIFETGPISVMSTCRAGFLIIAESLSEISTNRSWRVLKTDSMKFRSPYLTRYGTDMMDVRTAEFPTGFEMPDFDMRDFRQAAEIINTDLEKWASITNWPLTEAPIKPLPETPKYAKKVMRSNVENAGDVLSDSGLTLPAGGPYFVEIDMGELTTSYVEMDFRYLSDKSNPVNISYAESYFKCREDGSLYKEVRDDAENSVFDGETDTAILGWGENHFETIFFRTFRFIRIDVSYTRTPITIKNLKFAETVYPLKIDAQCELPQKDREMWDVSVNTLRLCIHDTYEDCPYYEQMQYTMDTSLQMIYTYYLSRDDVPARIAIDSFSASRLPDGLVASNYPSKFLQVIPGFSMYYIDMLYRHYMYHGDIKLIKKYLCVAESVLSYFWDKIDPETGLFPRSEYWEFTDWVQEWHGEFGVPITKEEKIHTIYHEMYIYFVKMAADLNEMIGRHGTAKEYRTLAESVKQAVLKHCYNEKLKYFTDTPTRENASIHGQLWAVLSGIVEGEEARELLTRAVNDPSLAKCSYSMTFYLFRAFEMTGLYGLVPEYLEIWHKMLAFNMTTWCEDPVTQRSDCHGWSSLPIYEFGAVTLGVRPLGPGYKEILIQPYLYNQDEARGSVMTSKGKVTVSWKKENGKVYFTADTPDNMVRVALCEEVFEFSRGGHIELELELR